MNGYRGRCGTARRGGSARSRSRPAPATAACRCPTARSPRSRSTSTRSARSRRSPASEYGMAGAVQHGASTLPAELFDRFPELGACEIHLATEFQNMLFDHPPFPAELKRESTSGCAPPPPTSARRRHRRAVLLQDAQEGARPVQARAVGAARKRRHDQIGANLRAKFGLLFDELGIAGTRADGRALRHARPGATAAAGRARRAGSGRPSPPAHRSSRTTAPGSSRR